MIITDFSKKTWSRLKKSAIYEGDLEEHWPFSGKKQNGWKGTFAGTHFRLRKPIIEHLFTFD